jgi:DNA segregation ATPase FtsK/SpoIIIE, S-DNA-T family
MFAVLGPVVAVASSVDAAVQRRRSKRSEAVRFDADVDRVGDAIDAAHVDERRADAAGVGLVQLLEQPAVIVARWHQPPGTETPVRVGSGEAKSVLAYDASGALDATGDPTVHAALDDLRQRASILSDAPVIATLTAGIGIIGPSTLAAAAARAITVQLAASLSPEQWRIEVPAKAEEWMSRLPHSIDSSSGSGGVRFTCGDRDILVVFGETVTALSRELDEVLEVSAGGVARIRGSALRPDFLGQEEASRAAVGLEGAARGAKLRRIDGSALPDALELGALESDDGAAAGLSATVGVGREGPMVLDLVTDGPHAIVAGTTGSGKSELLLSWVVGMAAGRSPADLTFLFVDFKGGASFGSLLDLPHAVGVITDLDAEQAVRALASLAAELRHRERELAAVGLRGIDQADPLPFPRLVVVVDEYAALVETFPTLHAVFADIAARGRSLGVHLILCTQRPAGVVRDGILANCALRISLRVTSAADSVAVLGTDTAASLPARPLGRALVSVGGGPPTRFQVALSGEQDVERAITRWAGSTRPRAPWLPPLPSHVSLEQLGASGLAENAMEGIPFALADLPAEQVQRPVAYRPRTDGALLVVGAAGSGKSGVMAALAASASASPFEVRRLTTELSAVWDFVTTALSGGRNENRIVLLDDIDSLIASCHEAYQAALVELLTRLLRDGPGHGLFSVLTTQRVAGAVHGLAALCGAPLILRMPGRAEHALVGGEAAEYVANLLPGAGHWHGARIQVAEVPAPAAATAPPRSVLVRPATARIAVVSSRPEQFIAALAALAPHRRIVPLVPVGFGSRPDDLEVSRGDLPPILIADPDGWQSQWSLLGTLQRGHDILFDGCSIADFRALSRSRELPPPFPVGTRTLWVRTPDGEVSRATLAEDQLAEDQLPEI